MFTQAVTPRSLWLDVYAELFDILLDDGCSILLYLAEATKTAPPFENDGWHSLTQVFIFAVSSTAGYSRDCGRAKCGK
ncbi:hypothetical protein D8S78_23060 [Natrialba swarupiae]|nr:hypothetical protein [Natrialba swarupiae]